GWGREPRAASREPRAASREPRAASREPRAASREPRAASREPRAASREPRAGSTGPIVTIDKTVADSFAGQFVSNRRIGKSVIPHRIVRIDVNVTLDTIATLDIFA